VNAYLYSPDVVRVTLVMGVIVSMLFYERLQLTTGGAIVPAYLALALQAPLTVTLTVLAGFITNRIVDGVISQRRILYGRRKFEVEVLTGLVIVGLAFTIRLLLHDLTSWDVTISTIGFLVPASSPTTCRAKEPRGRRSRSPEQPPSSPPSSTPTSPCSP
jgi:poly-gamma-glutamate biosynthesis protein PgsC/CapC